MITLAYGRTTRRCWRPSGLIVLCIVGLAIAVLTFALHRARFSYVSVCPTCGDVLETTEWQVPFTRTTYYTSTRESPTLLSAALAKRTLSTAQVHQWKFVWGSGNGVGCDLATGKPCGAL